MSIRLIPYDQLKPEKGIGYSKTQLWRLMKAGKFPRAVKLGESRNAWVEAEIDAWIKERMAARDAEAA